VGKYKFKLNEVTERCPVDPKKCYRGEICNELCFERYLLPKDAAIGFYHPMGTHDDVFWSIAIAVYATSQMQPEQFITVVPR
jgi:hypothetical protein